MDADGLVHQGISSYNPDKQFTPAAPFTNMV